MSSKYNQYKNDLFYVYKELGKIPNPTKEIKDILNFIKVNHFKEESYNFADNYCSDELKNYIYNFIDEKTECEEWKIIHNIRSYAISNIGRVFSNKTKKILSTHKDDRGYLRITITDSGRVNNLKIHRLVAIEFVENPNNYNQVNHKDENKLNNFFDNLEWCTCQYNNKYGTRAERIRKSIPRYYGKDNWNSKAIIQKDLDNNFIKKWDSMSDVERELGIDNSNISACCMGKTKKSGGFMWEYCNE